MISSVRFPTLCSGIVGDEIWCLLALGSEKLFGLELTNKFSGIEERQQQGEQTLVTDGSVSAGGSNGGLPLAGLSK